MGDAASDAKERGLAALERARALDKAGKTQEAAVLYKVCAWCYQFRAYCCTAVSVENGFLDCVCTLGSSINGELSASRDEFRVCCRIHRSRRTAAVFCWFNFFF